VATMNKNDDPGEGPVLSDEEWSEFERSFTKESARSAEYKEPSARQRELTEKWKREPPKDTGFRNYGAPGDARPRRTGGGVSRVSRVSAPVGRLRPWLRSLTWIVLALLVTVAIIAAPKLL
jgi:hypothetical protein